MYIQQNPTFAPLVGEDKTSGEHRGLVGKALARLSAFVEHANQERAKQKAIEDLQQLDDQALKDIGITRHDIREVVRLGRQAA